MIWQVTYKASYTSDPFQCTLEFLSLYLPLEPPFKRQTLPAASRVHYTPIIRPVCIGRKKTAYKKHWWMAFSLIQEPVKVVPPGMFNNMEGFLHSRRDQNRKKLVKTDSPEIKIDSIKTLWEHITSHCFRHSLQHLLKQHQAYSSADQFKLKETCQQHNWMTALQIKRGDVGLVQEHMWWQCFLFHKMIEFNNQMQEAVVCISVLCSQICI